MKKIPSAEYEFLQKLLKDRLGFMLPSGNDLSVINKLQPIAASFGLMDAENLIRRLRFTEDTVLTDMVCQAMTNKETSFFRGSDTFETLKNTVLPELINKNKEKKILRIWSAGCSTGQEPYSIAIMLNEDFPELKEWEVFIVATDISESVLKTAYNGTYSEFEIRRGMPENIINKYFSRVRDKWKISPSLRDKITFIKFNFLDSFPVSDRIFDIVFFRNVMIYLNDEVKKTILNNLSQIIDKNGYLFLGDSETLFSITDKFIQVRKSCYCIAEK